VAQGRKVLCRGFTSRGAPTKDCRITAELPDGTVLAQGRTDDKGEFSFEVAQPADLKIVLDAGSGHRAECSLKVEELSADLPAAAGQAAGPRTQADAQKRVPPSDVKADPQGVALDQRTLEQIVRSVVQEEMLALRGDLQAAEDRGPGITEIVGGIGYIVGIMGVVMYVRSRNKILKE